MEGPQGTFTHIFSKISSFDIGHLLKRQMINITSMKRFVNNREKNKVWLLLKDKNNLLQVKDKLLYTHTHTHTHIYVYVCVCIYIYIFFKSLSCV